MQHTHAHTRRTGCLRQRPHNCSLFLARWDSYWALWLLPQLSPPQIPSTFLTCVHFCTFPSNAKAQTDCVAPKKGQRLQFSSLLSTHINDVCSLPSLNMTWNDAEMRKELTVFDWWPQVGHRRFPFSLPELLSHQVRRSLADNPPSHRYEKPTGRTRAWTLCFHGASLLHGRERAQLPSARAASRSLPCQVLLSSVPSMEWSLDHPEVCGRRHTVRGGLSAGRPPCSSLWMNSVTQRRPLPAQASPLSPLGRSDAHVTARCLHRD